MESHSAARLKKKVLADSSEKITPFVLKIEAVTILLTELQTLTNGKIMKYLPFNGKSAIQVLVNNPMGSPSVLHKLCEYTS